MAKFELHPDFLRDTFTVAKLPLCQIQLMNNRLFPWLILIPAVADAKEIIDLSEVDRGRLMDEICFVSDVLKKAIKPDKLNVAALGNMTPQLHVHVIARFTKDAAWPKPVWGHIAEPYAEKEQKQLIAALHALLQR
ncbi:MAG: HIT family protein [Proteobacteria bacterium]|nr:HIT family protein [Pseudomonadota bacterium]